jgi:hypothetical protein
MNGHWFQNSTLAPLMRLYSVSSFMAVNDFQEETTSCIQDFKQPICFFEITKNDD